MKKSSPKEAVDRQFAEYGRVARQSILPTYPRSFHIILCARMAIDTSYYKGREVYAESKVLGHIENFDDKRVLSDIKKEE